MPIRRNFAGPGVRRLCDAVGLTVVVTALGTVAGWAVGSQALVRVLPSYPPLYPSAALGLLAAALAVSALGRGNRRLTLAGAVVALSAGAASLAGDAAGRSTAGCLLLTGAAALLAAGERPFWRRAGAGVLATGVGAFGLVTLACYGTGVLEEVRFDLVAGMSIQAGCAFVLLAGALLTVACQGEPAGGLPDWTPWAAGAACLMVTVFVWRALIAQYRRQVVADTAAQAFVARHDIGRAMDALTTTLRILPASAPPEEGAPGDWPTSVRRVTSEVPGMAAVLLSDRSLNLLVDSAVGLDSASLSRALRTSLRGRETPSARVTRDSVLLGVGPVAAGSRLLALAVPLCGNTECTGYVVALLRADQFLRHALLRSIPGYYAAVSARGESLFRSTAGAGPGRVFAQVVSLDIGALHLDVEAWPTARRLGLDQPQFPGVVAALGLLLSALLALTFWLTQRSLHRTRLEERARLVLALETATDGVWEWDLPTGSGNVSDALWRRLGYEPDAAPSELDLARWRSLVHPEDQRRLLHAIDRHVRGEAPSFDVEYRIRARNGDWHTMVERGRVAERDSSGRPLVVLGIAADVTERKRADEALLASEQRLRAMFDSAFQFQTLLDLEGHCLETNWAALAFAGVTVDAVRGRPLWETPWWAGSVAQQERLRQACAAAAAGETVRYEAEWLVDGGRALVDFSIKPILDGEGCPVQLLAEGRDVTDTRRVENAMREMETLSTMGRLAARVAHEVNNPLAGIQNSFLLIKDAVPETHPYYAYVGAIEREIGRISAVTRQLYETYRPDPEEAREASVSTIVSDAVSLLRQVNRAANVTVDVDVSRAPATLPIPSAVLRQAVYNLVQNAIEVSPPGGRVRVGAAVDSRVFSLWVCDQGEGVPPALREQIFAPFFSTKSGLRTSGMGLGLALVRRSVDALGGCIAVGDLPEGGSEFRVEIPLPRLSDPKLGRPEP